MGKEPEIDVPELSLDLFRTFATHPVLSTYKALEVVRRVVTAFGRRNQTNAFCTNVNYMAAFLLAVMGLNKEEEVFWVVTALLESRLPASSVLEVGFFDLGFFLSPVLWLLLCQALITLSGLHLYISFLDASFAMNTQAWQDKHRCTHCVCRIFRSCWACFGNLWPVVHKKCRFCHNIQTGALLAQGTAGDNVEQRMFSVLVERKHPRLMEIFDRLECSLAGLTGEWFSRMFTTALPAETAARVWDCIMVEGPKVLFRAALSLIKVTSLQKLKAHVVPATDCWI